MTSYQMPIPCVGATCPLSVSFGPSRLQTFKIDLSCEIHAMDFSAAALVHGAFHLPHVQLQVPAFIMEIHMKNGKKRRAWTSVQVRELKSLAKKKTPARKIAKSLKRTEGATRQKAFSMGLSLNSRV